MGKDKKKHKKEKKHKKHRKEKRKSSSNSSDSSENEWVEQVSQKVEPTPSQPGTSVIPNKDEDSWGSIFSGVSTAEIRKAKAADKLIEKVSLVVKPGQSTRELNPYWKDGGTGLPPDRNQAKNTAFRRPDDDDEHKNDEKQRLDSRSPKGRSFRRPNDDDESTMTRNIGEKSRYNSGSSGTIRFQMPKDDDSDDRRGNNSESSRGNRFRRPYDHEEKRSTFERNDNRSSRSEEYRSNSESSGRFSRNREDSDRDENRYRSKYQSSRGWKKTPSSSSGDNADKLQQQAKPRSGSRSPSNDDTSSRSKLTETPADRDRDVNQLSISEPKERQISQEPSQSLDEPKILTSDEINALNAKIFKAEMAGKVELVAKLRAQLENSRRAVEQEKTVILTQTDSKGFTRPVSRDDRVSSGSKNKRKVQTHENSKRVRYFADDDDFSLQDMYEKEKYSTAQDQEADFMNLMGKEMSRKDGSLALDDPFEETASIDDRDKRDKQQWDRAVRVQAKKEKVYDECKWCFGAKRMNQNLVVKTKDKAYVACPPFQSLTEGHCIIIPNSHVSCSIQLDEDVWEDIMDLRKDLVRRLEANDEDCVFFETASFLHKFPHMMIHCVPLPREIGDMAPIYFKKALLDCESEWSNNKKVVDLAGRGLRKSVPKGLPYFFVDFGNQSGFAHVIEDQKLFPNNFAQEIVGGMLDLNHELWRKQRNVSEEDLTKNLNYLKNLMNDD